MKGNLNNMCSLFNIKIIREFILVVYNIEIIFFEIVEVVLVERLVILYDKFLILKNLFFF